MPQILGIIVIGLATAIGLGLGLYNMRLAWQGWRSMRQVSAQKATADAEHAAMETLTARCDALRKAVKARYGSDYPRIIKPVDHLVSNFVTEILASEGKSASAAAHLKAACTEMERLLLNNPAEEPAHDQKLQVPDQIPAGQNT